MPSGFKNALNTCMRPCFEIIIGRFLVVYFCSILVHRKNINHHVEHLKEDPKDHLHQQSIIGWSPWSLPTIHGSPLIIPLHEYNYCFRPWTYAYNQEDIMLMKHIIKSTIYSGHVLSRPNDSSLFHKDTCLYHCNIMSGPRVHSEHLVI